MNPPSTLQCIGDIGNENSKLSCVSDCSMHCHHVSKCSGLPAAQPTRSFPRVRLLASVLRHRQVQRHSGGCYGQRATGQPFAGQEGAMKKLLLAGTAALLM